MTPVLDKGYAKLIGSPMDGAAVQQLVMDFNQGVFHHKFLDIPVMTLEVKCPLFVQMFLMETGLKVIPQRIDTKTIEAYIPTAADLGIRDIATSNLIQDSIQQTTEALLVNPTGYQMDGCNRFISQITSPISVYNTLVVYGSLNTWLEITERKGLPKPIEEYRKAFQGIVHAEWAAIKPWLKRKT